MTSRTQPDRLGADPAAEPMPEELVLQVRGLTKTFPVRAGLLRRPAGAVTAVDRIDLDVRAGRTLALVGESGSGKSTTARCLLRLVEPDAGTVRLRMPAPGRDGGTVVDVLSLAPADLRRLREHVQIVFQDPYASLNPRMTVRQAVEEPLIEHRFGSKAERRARVDELLAMVGLRPEQADRYPVAFSGGQRQRIGIARALALAPRLLVLDEPVSSLDVSVQGQILNLFADLQEQLGLSYVLIAHDLSVVRHASDRVAVMYLGALMEEADREDLFDHPLHPYTVALLSAVPDPDDAVRRRQRILLTGELPSPAALPPGCRFATRCPVAQPRCSEVAPRLREVLPGHRVACHYPGSLAADGLRQEPAFAE